MKKIILFVLVLIIILGGVIVYFNQDIKSEEKEEIIKSEEIDLDIVFEDGTYYAVENLGYNIEETHDISNEGVPIIELPGDEYYFIVPRYTNMSVKVYQNIFDEEKILIHSSEVAVPFVISGNESDLFPNIEIEFTTIEGEKIICAPFISLEDGSLIIEKGTEVINIF